MSTDKTAGIFDTHAHYDDPAFDEDREELLVRLPEQGIIGVMDVGFDVESSRRATELAARCGYIYAAVGIHPEEAGKAVDSDLRLIRELSLRPKVCAIGEIGLDYHYEDACPREIQKQWFRRLLALATERDLPVIIHDRDAHEDTMELLREYRPRGVVHCFSGSVEMMREVVAMGMYVGLGGAVTFKNAVRPVEVAAAVPADRLLVETDAPYMAPVPCRGTRCDSSMIAHTAARLAEIRGVALEELLRTTAENGERLFGVSVHR